MVQISTTILVVRDNVTYF